MKGKLGTGGRCAFALCIAWEACLLENKETETEKKPLHAPPISFGNWETPLLSLFFYFLIFRLCLLCDEGLK